MCVCNNIYIAEEYSRIAIIFLGIFIMFTVQMSIWLNKFVFLFINFSFTTLCHAIQSANEQIYVACDVLQRYEKKWVNIIKTQNAHWKIMSTLNSHKTGLNYEIVDSLSIRKQKFFIVFLLALKRWKWQRNTTQSTIVCRCHRCFLW